MHDDKQLSYYKENIITIELLWQSLMPHIPAPHGRFIATWLNHYTFEQISTTLEHVAQYCESRSIGDPDHVGRIASRKLRTRYGSDENVRALHIPA